MSMKKKKKKKAEKGEEGTGGPASATADGETEPVEASPALSGQVGENLDVEAVQGENSEELGHLPSAESWLGSDRDYTYRELLGRVFGILRTNNPDLAGEKRKFTIVPPQVVREGSKKTAFSNIADLARRMRRPLEHLTAFILTELGTIGSSDGAQRLIIKGRFQQLQIENVLRRYIVEYVTCKTCRSPDTILVKENRLFFMQCESCGSSRSVTAIKSGFKAQTEKRSSQRTG
jgi:translation initiation factor 2 subunit 2